MLELYTCLSWSFIWGGERQRGVGCQWSNAEVEVVGGAEGAERQQCGRGGCSISQWIDFCGVGWQLRG